jgi:hypothetical protein
MKTNLEEALDIRFDSDAGNNLTIRDYLRILLETLWDEGEGFSGKRPFGNSGWEYELYRPLVKHGFVRGTLDEDGYIDTFDADTANKLVFDMIRFIFKEKA